MANRDDTIGARPDRASWGVRRGDAPPPFYRGLRAVVKTALRAFYRTVEVTGLEHLNATRPTILASNHPNSIVDPLLVGVFEERQVGFVARDGLFKVPGFGRVLRAIGAIPIRRRSEHKDGADNSDAFQACVDVLAEGGVISIFPEGKTHQDLKIQHVKTGTARIALQAESGHDKPLGVRIVPVGLNYLVRQAFRSDVHVAFGEPIDVAQFMGRASGDPREAVRELTAQVDAALKELAIHVEEVEDERIIAQVTSIVVDIRGDLGLDGAGQTPAERTALVRRIVDAYRWLDETDPARTAELRRRLQWYLEERSALGLGGDSAALQHRTEHLNTSEHGWERRRRLLVLGAPLALWGFANSAAPYAVLRGLLRVIKPRKDRQALTKLLAGAGVYGAFWAGQTSACTMALGPIAGTVYGMSLPVSALFALRYMTEARLHRLTLSGLRALVREGDRLDNLRAEREALKGEIAALRDAYLGQLGEAAPT